MTDSRSTHARSPDEPNREAFAADGRLPYKLLLGAILAAALLARLAIDVALPTQPVSDFWEYMRGAQSLARTGRYEASGVPIGWHPPAYSLLLSLALRLAPAGHELFTAKIVNASLAVLTCLFGATLARRFWGNSAGLWTAAWLAVLPRALLMADLIASENLFAALFLLFLLLASASWTRGRSLATVAALGLVIGLAALTRSVAYFLPIVWIVGAAAARRPWRRVAGELVLILAIMHAILLPWAIRNARTLGRFTFWNTVGGIGLFLGNNENATGRWYDWTRDLGRLRADVRWSDLLAVDDAAREEAWRWIRANPVRAARLYGHKLLIVMTDDCVAANFAIFAAGVAPPLPPADALPSQNEVKRHPREICGLLRVSGIALAAAGVGGLLLLVRRAREGSSADRVLAVGLLAAALSIPVLSSPIAVNGRYRWPTEDALTPAAGLFLAHLFRRRAERR